MVVLMTAQKSALVGVISKKPLNEWLLQLYPFGQFYIIQNTMT